MNSTARSAAGSCPATSPIRSSGSTTCRRKPFSGGSAPGTWRAGSIPRFQFALDWDLFARFHIAGCKVVRVPYFLGCFRVHAEQKTSQDIHTVGANEMSRVRLRFHGPDKDHASMIERHARRIRLRGALSARLMAAGIRW